MSSSLDNQGRRLGYDYLWEIGTHSRIQNREGRKINLNISLLVPNPILALACFNWSGAQSVENGGFCNFQFALLHFPHHFKHSRGTYFPSKVFFFFLKVINLCENTVLRILSKLSSVFSHVSCLLADTINNKKSGVLWCNSIISGVGISPTFRHFFLIIFVYNKLFPWSLIVKYLHNIWQSEAWTRAE